MRILPVSLSAEEGVKFGRKRNDRTFIAFIGAIERKENVFGCFPPTHCDSFYESREAGLIRTKKLGRPETIFGLDESISERNVNGNVKLRPREQTKPVIFFILLAKRLFCSGQQQSPLGLFERPN